MLSRSSVCCDQFLMKKHLIRLLICLDTNILKNIHSQPELLIGYVYVLNCFLKVLKSLDQQYRVENKQELREIYRYTERTEFEETKEKYVSERTHVSNSRYGRI